MGFSLKNIFKDDDDIDNLNGTEDGYYNISEEDAIKEADKTATKAEGMILSLGVLNDFHKTMQLIVQIPIMQACWCVDQSIGTIEL